MSKKITWNTIRQDLKNHHPKISKSVVYWRPYNFATIVLYLNTGELATYNFDTKKVKKLSERWKM